MKANMYASDKQLMRYETILRRIRSKIFSYSDDKQDKAHRIISKIKDKLEYTWYTRSVTSTRRTYADVMWM